MENIKIGLAVIVANFIAFNAMGGLFGTFSINLLYLISIIIIFILLPSSYLVIKQRKKINDTFEEVEEQRKLMEGTYPPTMSISDISTGQSKPKSCYWKEYIKESSVSLLLLGAPLLFVVYGISVSIHNNFVPFATYQQFDIKLISSKCPPWNATVQVCDLVVKKEDNTFFTIQAPVNVAEDMNKESNYVIEYKFSFIGKSISRYRAL